MPAETISMAFSKAGPRISEWTFFILSEDGMGFIAKCLFVLS
jgi:hypothetical protein